MCVSVGTDLDVRRVPEVRRADHLGRDGKTHNIRSGGRAMQHPPRDIFFSIVGDQMMVRAGHLHGYGLGRVSQRLSGRINLHHLFYQAARPRDSTRVSDSAGI